MEITEVRVKLVERPSERLRAFCSITLDGDFVIRDLKIIGGTNGAFVAMPSRKLSDRCGRCGSKNHLRAKFCNDCGSKLNENRAPRDGQGRAKLHADVAHPINAACRERIQAAVIQAYEAELERSKSPDYEPPSFDDFDDDFGDDEAPVDAAPVSKDQRRDENGGGRGGNGDRGRRGQRGRRRDRGRDSGRTEAAPPRHDREPVADERDPGKPRRDEPDSPDTFGDYNSLIADLKREAATRQEERRQRHSAESGFRFEDEPVDEEAPQVDDGQEQARQDIESADHDQDESPPLTDVAPASAAPPIEPARTDDDNSFGAGLF